MTLPNFTEAELRRMEVPQLIKIAEDLLDEYSKVYDAQSPSPEAGRIRDLIVEIHNILDEKIENGKK